MSAADLPDDLFTEIQGAFRKAPVLLVGSGFSCGYGLPGMGALAEHLANTVDGVLTTDQAKKSLGTGNRGDQGEPGDGA